MAIALGCCLFTYVRGAIGELWEIVTEPTPDELRTNLGRIERRIREAITHRFKHAGRFDGHGIQTKKPSPDEAALVEEAMAIFRPWGTDHFAEESPALIERLRALPELQRKHALLCTTCAGLACLVTQWNDSRSPRSLDRFPAPLTMLRVPMFPNASSNPNNWRNDFDPNVSDNELEELRLLIVDQLESSCRRRGANQFRRFRVCVDDEEWVQFTREERTVPPLTVPLSALSVQVFGQDADGELPLGVFYLPDLEVGDDAQRLSLVLESGATIELTVAPVEMGDEETIARQVTIRLTEDEAPAAKSAGAPARKSALSERVVRWLSPSWIPQWVDEEATAADIPEQAQVFHLEDGDITISYTWRAEYQNTPATLYVSWRANLHTPSDIWLRFTQAGTAAFLTEVRLGSSLVGEEILSRDTLGFDPSRERWAMAVILKDLPA